MAKSSTATKPRRNTAPDQHLARRRIAFGILTRPRVVALAYALGQPSRVKADAIDAIVGELCLEPALALLKVDEIRAMLEALGDVARGRKSTLLAKLAIILNSKAAPRAKGPSPKLAPVRALKGQQHSTTSGGNGANTTVKAEDYRHNSTRKNNPPSGLIEHERTPPKVVKRYSYDPHLDPQLEWSGKTEHPNFEVDTVSLHIHERISTQAIVRAAMRESDSTDLNLFAKPHLSASKEIDFYSHEVGWSNRLVLGDSLLVMNSLLERESMAGQVQCIFMDPPYGVKFNSNFQPSILRRSAMDGDDALTREPEQIQAYRDTWELGIHSYLTYLRDRLLLAHELLATTGALFLQIGDQNLDLVIGVASEVFGRENLVSIIPFRKKTMPFGAAHLEQMNDFLIFFSRSKESLKYRQLYVPKDVRGDQDWVWYLDAEGQPHQLTESQHATHEGIPKGARLFRLKSLEPSGEMAAGKFSFDFEGREYPPPRSGYGTDLNGMKRLAKLHRLQPKGNLLNYRLFLDDYPVSTLTASWMDTVGADDKRYVVQTNTEVVKRCILMTTDPSDLVLDPTCGSGTTPHVAEQWGRRWIACDTSRVALSIARQRLLTARFPFYQLRTSQVKDGFRYKQVAHVTLKSIAQNPKLDLCSNLTEMQTAIAEAGNQETLYDSPMEDKKRVRVSGPFTTEAITLASMEDPLHEADAQTSRSTTPIGAFSDDVQSYLGTMMDLIRQSGVNFAGNKRLRIPNIRSAKGNLKWFHAEGTADADDATCDVAISFGPRHGPVTPTQVLGAITETRGKQILVFVGFACDPEARKIIDRGVPGRELFYASAAPDIIVGDLLKKRKMDQLFSVFGAPDVRVHRKDGGPEVSVELRGIDLYDPTTGRTNVVNGDQAAAIFVDHDYDGKSFCVSQAMFPGGGANAWEKIQRALKGTIDEETFNSLRSSRSIPFKPGPVVAVKVIDDRGNEVIKLVEV